MLISSSYKCTKILFKYSYRITKNNLKTFGNRDSTKNENWYIKNEKKQQKKQRGKVESIERDFNI